MKKPSLKDFLAVSIFLLISFATIIIVGPAYRAVSKRIHGEFENALTSFEEKTGLRVSYKSLSPSVFTGLRIKNIILSDVSNGNRIVEIKKTVVRYSIPKLFMGEGLESIRDITVDGFYLDLDRNNSLALEKIKSFFQKENQDLEKEAKHSKVQKFNLENLVTSLPFNVFVKNLQIRVRDGEKSADLLLKKITLAYLNISRQILVKSSGNIKYNSGKKKIYTAAFSADGYIPQVLEGSSLTLRFSDLSNGDFALNHLNLVLGYKNRNFEIKTIQNGYPLYISGHYNLDNGNCKFAVHSKNLKPDQTISVRNSGVSMKKIRNLSVTLNGGFEYFPEEKKFEYSSDAHVEVPSELYNGGFVTEYNLSGDNKKLTVSKFFANGKKIDTDFSGEYEFDGMKLSGELNVNSFELKNGGVISTEVYFDPKEKGFVAFAPQFMMDQKALTALELNVTPVNDSVDFGFELSDYSHFESEKPGNLKINGSYIGGTKYVQLNLSSNAVYLDSIAQTGSFFGKKKSDSKFAFLSKYIFNGEMFISTDFKNLSFNVPYAFAVNTKKEGEMLFLSLDGNDSSLQVSHCDFLSGGKISRLQGMFEKSPEGKDAFFIADLSALSVPYHFTGNIMPENISVNGDYGFSFNIRKTSKNKFQGNIGFQNFPVAMADSIFTLSADSVFSYSEENGIDFRINRIEGEEAGEKYLFNPKFMLSGSVTKYGAFLDSIVYSDKFSTLQGSSELLWNINDSLFDSATFNFNLKNPLSKEAVNCNLNFSNPSLLELNAENVKKNFYFNSQIVLNHLGLNRFTAEQSDNNEVTGTVIASGTLENPYAGINIEGLDFSTAGKIVSVKGSAYVEEKNLTIDNVKVKYNNFNIDGVKALFDLNTFTGKVSCAVDAVVAKRTLNLPLEFSVSDTVIESGKIFPKEFAANLMCKKVSGTLLKKTFPLSLTILHSENVTNIFTSESQGISGKIEDGKIDFSIAEGKPVKFNLKGDIKGEKLAVSVRDINVNAGELFAWVDVDKLKIYNGLMKGRVDITGLKSDPEFNGTFSVSHADFSLPSIISQHITVPKALFIINQDVIEMPVVTGMVKKEYPITAKLNVFFDRWSFERLELKLKNPEGVYMPGDFEIRLAHFVGDVNLDLLLAFQDHYLDVTGDVKLKKTTGSVKTRELANQPPKRSWWPRADINIHFGQHCTFIFDPLLRAVLIPDTDFGFKYDMVTGDLELDGELAFRSGDISYLSRNFYLKNGYMKFNSNDPTFNPLINLHAETRERDDKGNDVRIILSATNQYLLDFNPQFSSIPAKSENEIRTLLGQIALGDSENVSSLLFATGDYAIQSTIGRSIENKLRDFLNFDILSVRTNILQNALSYGLQTRSDESEKKNFMVGNFFDNSTVYIGKYFGSTLYMDALMHWSYDETRIDDDMVVNGLVFRPEFGLEVESPFGNIRWNMAPDINGIKNDRFVSSTSVTLSWKFSF